MSALEIVLIIVGVVVLVLGYFMPGRKKELDEEVQLISEDEIRRLISKETEDVQKKVADIVDEGVKYAMENTERSMEKLSNEKIMAINEYSDTVLEEINKNHQEVTFLYDMLNDKHDNLVNTISEMTVKADEITQSVRDAEVSAQEATRNVADMQGETQVTIDRLREEVQSAIDRMHEETQTAVDRIREAEQSVQAAKENVEDAVNRVMVAAQNAQVNAETLHSAEPYKEAVIEEVREAVEEDTFKPIMPKRVEIIHEPDGDYIAPQEQQPAEPVVAEPAVEEPAVEEPEPEPEKTKPEKKSRKKPARKESVDIQFAQGSDGSRNSNERILELHKAGKSNMAIAKELGLGIGEVKLVIDLFKGM